MGASSDVNLLSMDSSSADPGGRAPEAVLPRRIHVGYALGALVPGAFGTVPGLLLLPYLTDTLGIAAGLGALLALLPKAWDVLVNPFIGRLSDRTRSRWGPRRPYLLAGGLVLAVLFAALFATPFRSGVAAAGYVAVVFLGAATAFAFFQVPFVAMPAELTSGYQERTRMMTWRIALFAMTVLISGAISPMVVKLGGEGVPGHRWMGLFVAVLIAAGALGVFFGTRSAPTGAVLATEPTLRAQLAVAGRNRPFRLLLMAFITQSVALAITLAGVNYYADHILHSPDVGAAIMFAGFMGPAMVVMPVWTRIGARVGKLRAFVWASLIFAAGALGLVAGPALPPIGVYLLTGVMGVGYAGKQVYALSMLPDCIAYDTARTGRRQAGVFTGLWTAGENFGMALGPAIFGLVLQLFGYVSSSTGIAAAQSDSARLGVLLGLSVLPAAVVVLSLPLLRGYDLTPQRLAEAELAASGKPDAAG
jgi:GPH family glycoside/pentoside/hexuronide:cation symporter